MSCNYKIVLVLDGGQDALLVPIVGLNYLEKRIDRDTLEQSVFSWIDLVVASGDSVLLGSLIAQGNSEVLNGSIDLERFLKHQNHGISDALTNNYFDNEVRLLDLKKHFNFLSFDIDTDEVYSFTDTNAMQQLLPVNTVLKACMSSPDKNQFVKLGFRHLTNISSFLPNPILQASHMASCLYSENPLLIISIGSGHHKNADEEQKYSESVEALFKNQYRQFKNWHYFRFNPEFEPTDSMVMKINKTYRYFENENGLMDRLLRLMELRNQGVA
jgi:hypothetical protein